MMVRWWMVLLVLAIGCGPVLSEDASSGTETSGADDDDRGDDVPGEGSAADSSPTGSPTSATVTAEGDGDGDSHAEADVDDGSMSEVTTDPTLSDSGGESEASDDGCAGECLVDDDCATGQTCIGCICFGNSPGCEDYGAGIFADCTPGDNSVCESDSAGCLVDNVLTPTAGVCFFPCAEICDCPAPPAGFESQLACDDLTEAGENECYINCEGGGECPPDMFCFANTICFFGSPPAEIPLYGDCLDQRGQCDDGFCMAGADGGYAVCAQACDVEGDCAAPTSGDAPVLCTDVTEDEQTECILDCSAGQTCPDGMACDPDGFGVCVWLDD
jgi:hypothetical protein